jgi:hypothetical protein
MKFKLLKDSPEGCGLKTERGAKSTVGPMPSSRHVHGSVMIFGRRYEIHVVGKGNSIESGKLTWRSAMAYSMDLGPGWRLPTNEEMREMSRRRWYDRWLQIARTSDTLFDLLLRSFVDVASKGVVSEGATFFEKLRYGIQRPVISLWTSTTSKSSYHHALLCHLDSGQQEKVYKEYIINAVCLREVLVG